jgi:hypothetical protein
MLFSKLIETLLQRRYTSKLYYLCNLMVVYPPTYLSYSHLAESRERLSKALRGNKVIRLHIKYLDRY